MKTKTWLTGFIITVLVLCGLIIGFVYYMDPFFHYHKPHSERYFYILDNQRCQNDGIVRHFDYDAIITGTSMIENFRTSDLDSLFGVRSIKVPYSGGAFKEVDTTIRQALRRNRDVKIVVRCLDIVYFLNDKDWERDDLGDYPTYLYDDNPFNDVEYVFNKDIIFDRAYNMIIESREEGYKPGITSFDEYSRWQDAAVMGRKEVCPDGLNIARTEKEIHLTDEERNTIKATVEQNIITTAAMYPNVEFYCYIAPYSMAWWCEHVSSGDVYKYVEAEEYAMELMTEQENIKLFAFDDRVEITGDLNNYRDATHYGEWVNRLILEWMRDDKGRIRKDNYTEFVSRELKGLLDFDYEQLNLQDDASDDAGYGRDIYERYKGQGDG